MVLLISLVTTFVLLGTGALVINSGFWYSERGQLQNGSDAGALAVAESCARGACNTSLASSEANNNANDASTTVDMICGNAPGSSPGLMACTAGQANGSYCPTAPAAGVGFVNVHTITPTNQAIGPVGALTGNSLRVKACAQARWGGPTSCGQCAPITMSECEWYKDTNNGTTFAQIPTTGTYHTSTSPFVAPPSYLDTLQARAADPAYGGFFAGITDPHSPRNNSTVAGSETILLAHAAGNNTGTGFGSTTCNTGSDGSNQTAPGEFGWLPLPAGGGNCTANVGSTYIGSTGSNGQDCSIQFTASRNNLQPIYIPVFATISGSGSNTTYTLDGYAAFVVTGWNVHGWSNGGCTSSADSIITGNDSSLNPSVGSPYTNTACSYSFNRVGTSGPPPPDYADYCRNYMGVNCGGNSQQAIYGYFTQALIPASQLPGGGGGGVNLGATTVSLSG